MSALPIEETRWHEGAIELADPQARLYRRDEWVTGFLAEVTDHLARALLPTVVFDSRRPALVVTGQSATGALRAMRVTYADVLLFHPGLHDDVEALLARAINEAAVSCARQGFAQGDALRRGGRQLLRREPELLLDPAVATSLAALGLHGPAPLGVSGVVHVRSSRGDYVLAARRSTRVALNPGCLAPPVDGGLTGTDALADLTREVNDELPWSFGRWEPLGALLPIGQASFVGERRTHRCGVNLVFQTWIDDEPHEVLARRPNHFGTSELVLLPVTGRDRPARLPTVLVARDGELEELVEPPEPSEVLAAALDLLDMVDLSTASTAPLLMSRSATATRDLATARRAAAPPIRFGPAAQAAPSRHDQPHHHAIEASPMRPSTPLDVPDLRIEDLWAEELIDEHPRLRDVLDPKRLLDIAGSGADEPAVETIAPMIDAVRELELIRRSGAAGAAGDARLFEAAVYRISRLLFVGDESVALGVHDHLLATPIGPTYRARLADALERDDRSHQAVGARLTELDRDEAATDHHEASRRCLLLCSCAALWSAEAKRVPETANLALDGRFRRSSSGEPIAGYFRARASLVDPKASLAQLQIGMQLVSAALAACPGHAGMHHTRALFGLRRSNIVTSERVAIDCLEQALEDAERALLSEPELPTLFATRAKINYRLHRRDGALADLQAAIELGRFLADHRAIRHDVERWELLLETWQLDPVATTALHRDPSITHHT
jgi:hypothetical protein